MTRVADEMARQIQLIEAGAEAASANLKTLISPVCNVLGYGAKGDGTYDLSNDCDTTAFNSAIAAASAKPYGGTVYVPEGHYMLSQTMTIPNNVRIIMAGGTIIDGIHCSGDAFRFQGGNWNCIHVFGTIQNYASGAAFKSVGQSCNLMQVYFNMINACQDGIFLDCQSTTILDSNWTGIYIGNCTNAGIHLKCGVASGYAGIQGQIFNINFIVQNLHAILFEGPANSAINTNIFNCYEVEGGGVANSTGITTTGGLGIYENVFHCEGFFGGFASWWVNAGSNDSEYHFNLTGTVTASNFLITGSGNKIYNLSSEQPNSSFSPIAMTTAVNTQASFNGGALLTANTSHLSITIPSGGLAAGAALAFYAYHAFTGQYSSLLHVNPRFAGHSSNYVPLAVVCCEDESIWYPNQIYIAVCAIAAVAAGTYTLDLTVGC